MMPRKALRGGPDLGAGRDGFFAEQVVAEPVTGRVVVELGSYGSNC
ncbi:MAG: hypothetical protein ACRD68_06055 [Pyrinomonadaceae bacterium]